MDHKLSSLSFHLLEYGHTICPSNWGMENETALFHRLYYIYGGNAWVWIDGSIRKLESGHLYLFPVMHPYTMWHEILHPLDVLWFHAEINSSAFVRASLCDLRIRTDDIMYPLLSALCMCCDREEPQSITEQLFEVLLSIMVNSTHGTVKADRDMENVLQYIQKHLQDPVSIDDLASVAGMERSYFSRKFRKACNMSPSRYLLAMKMNYASRLLDRGLTVEKTSELVGYQSAKAFSRAFKKYMEISPSQYKKCHILQP